jgi:hypothetical protein
VAVRLDDQWWTSRAGPDAGTTYPMRAVASLAGGIDVFGAVGIIELPDGRWDARACTVDGWRCDASHLLSVEDRRRLADQVRALLEESDPDAPVNGGKLA